jgi:hypothetical protein
MPGGSISTGLSSTPGNAPSNPMPGGSLGLFNLPNTPSGPQIPQGPANFPTGPIISPSGTTQGQQGPQVALNLPPTNAGPQYKGDPNQTPITPAQLNLLDNKLATEIKILSASGTTDPITQARITAFEQIQNQVNNMNSQLQKGNLKPQDIPIRAGDYNKFLPAIGNKNAGITGLLSKSGHNNTTSLLNSYRQGKISRDDMSRHLFQVYSEALLKGVSFNIDFKYTGANEVAVRQAEAAIAMSAQGRREGFEDQRNPDNRGYYDRIFGGRQRMIETSHPMTTQGSRGAFDEYIRKLDLQIFGNDLNSPPPPKPDSGINWKDRALNIYNNIKNFGLDPADFGCKEFPDEEESQYNFSWRGYTKMICTRLATHIDPGVPVQIGCPPVSWKGWNA